MEEIPDKYKDWSRLELIELLSEYDKIHKKQRENHTEQKKLELFRRHVENQIKESKYG